MRCIRGFTGCPPNFICCRSVRWDTETPLCSLFRKEQSSKTQESTRTKQDTIRQSESPHKKTGQGKPKQSKESQKKAKVSEVHSLPLVGVPQKHQTKSYNMYGRPVTDPHRPTQAKCLLFQSLWVYSSLNTEKSSWYMLGAFTPVLVSLPGEDSHCTVLKEKPEYQPIHKTFHLQSALSERCAGAMVTHNLFKPPIYV